MTAMNRMPSGYKVNCCEATRESTLGYKQTEVGVIPEDWNVMQFGELAAPRKERADPKKSGIHEFCIELEHVGQASGRLLGSTSTGVSASLKTVFQVDDVLFGKLRAYLRKYWLAESEGVCSTEIWALVANPRLATPNFIYQVVTSDSFIEAASNSYGTHMPRSDWNLVKNCTFATPPLPEQRAIATALSDVDALLGAQEKLIAKKRDIKQAAMQQLITGKQRLPGFQVKHGYKQTELGMIPEDWNIQKVGDIAAVGRGRVISHREISAAIHSAYPVYSSQTSNNGIMGCIDTYDFEGEYITWTTDGEKAGTVFYRNGRFNCTNVCGTIQMRKHNALYVSKVLGTLTTRYVSRNLANPKLMNDVVKQILLPLPPTLDEQTAIAAVLSDMDADLAALEQQRDKTRALKQGMMQELLTGRIRLV